MSDTSGPIGTVLALPSGGGAVQGIGETFTPDLHTGTGHFAVPIALPVGRNSLQPQLQLAYSPGSGNGPFGLGWSLSVPGITRKTAKGIPLYDDAHDTFILSGAEDLTAIGLPQQTQHSDATETVTWYRPRTEGLFARISHHVIVASGAATSANYWRVQSKDGVVSYYGTPASGTERDLATIHNPQVPSNVFAWKLTETRDPFGNRIEYHYAHDTQPHDGPHTWDQVYLREIRYADYGDPASPSFNVSVHFLYAPNQSTPAVSITTTPDQNRPDPFSDYRAGFEIRTVQRCTDIQVFSHAPIAVLTRTYQLRYADQPTQPGSGVAPDTALVTPTQVSLLREVLVRGHDSDASEMLPPLRFDYSAFSSAQQRLHPIQGADLPSFSLAHPTCEMVDLHGNGLQDILQMDAAGARYWRNLGNARFDRPRLMPRVPGGAQLDAPGVRLMDANGDGRMDLLVTTGALGGYYPLAFDQAGWDARSFQRYRQAPSFDLKDPEVRLVDLDGDGVTDAIRSGTRMELYFNDPQVGWTPERTRWVERRAPEVFPNVNFSDVRVHWADMTGDGLQDIVLVHSELIEYWPACGYGNWGNRITMRTCPHFPDGYNPLRILLGDVDGDGCADLLYIDDQQVTLWLNQSGNGWSAPIVFSGTPTVSDMDAVRLVDLLGTGVSGILWSRDTDGSGRPSMYFLDFTDSTKPYLLCQMANGSGAQTRVSYVPSTQFYLDDAQVPATRWQTPLAFPVQVVAQVEVFDALSGGKRTTEYRYHHGYWDGAEREFRGFGRVDQRDSETFARYTAHAESGDEGGTRAHDTRQHLQSTQSALTSDQFSPPTETRTWFHQGPVGPEHGDWREADYTAEYWPEDPVTFATPEVMRSWLASLPQRAARDASRALRGSVLRTELYALDDSLHTARPYTVTEALYGLCEVVDALTGNGEPTWEVDLHSSLAVSPPTSAGGTGTHPTSSVTNHTSRIFFPQKLLDRVTHWERGSDPMTRLSATDDYDSAGQPRRQISVAVPRGRAFQHTRQPHEPGADYLATYSTTTYAQPVAGTGVGRYLADRVATETTYEILNDGSTAALDVIHAVQQGEATVRVIGHTRYAYDFDEQVGAVPPPQQAFTGLPVGQVGRYGALVSTEKLVLTPQAMLEIYAPDQRTHGTGPLDIAGIPPYLIPMAAVAWTNDYPATFRQGLAALAGYIYREASRSDPTVITGYYALAERRRYDFHDDPQGLGRGLVTAHRDALGADTTIAYDTPYQLLPVAVTNAAGLTTRAAYDYRVFQPATLTDVNGNQRQAAYSPLGLPVALWTFGKPGEAAGDTLATPGTQFLYDLTAFVERGQPVSVRTIRRTHHATATDVPSYERDQTIELIEYSDGFGRLIQTRTQAEDMTFGALAPGDIGLPADGTTPTPQVVGQLRDSQAEPLVIVSGWQVYDNKGRVIERYEPLFSTGWEYTYAANAPFDKKIVMRYDPLGRVVRTIFSDGSEQRALHGVPGSVAAPDVTQIEQYEPTPWETYTYDANDNAGRTHSHDSQAYRNHWDTPASTVVDALGRTIATTVRNGSLPAGDWFTTCTTYDIRGNTLTVADALGRVALRHTYDLANRQLRTESLDAGAVWVTLDAAGALVERRDAKGAVTLHRYDDMHRATHIWARDTAEASVTLRQRHIYGDDSAALDGDVARTYNLLGKLLRRYDEAGLAEIVHCDFKSNVLEQVQQVIRDERLMQGLASDGTPILYTVDWEPPTGETLDAYAASLLAVTTYRTTTAYDALNRIVHIQAPHDVRGTRAMLKPRYNRAGALAGVAFDNAPYVEQIAYNARGQRTFIAYGNAVITRYAYDAQTFRLVRLRSERGTTSPDAPLIYRATAPDQPLQDLCYAYDLAGNILTITETTPGSGVRNNAEAALAPNAQLSHLLITGDALIRHFTYDPLYRLSSVTGRECATAPTPRPWEDTPNCGYYAGPPTVPTTTNAPDVTAVYSERYNYDPVGNLVALTHQVGATGAAGWTRALGIGGMTPAAWAQAWQSHLNASTSWDGAPGNQLTHASISGAVAPMQSHWYDSAGNLLRETASRVFAWDHADRLRAFWVQAGTAEPSLRAYYLYDASGQRIKKVVQRQGGQFETTVYIAGLFEHHQRTNTQGQTQENNTLHIVDNQQRIALVRIGAAFTDDYGPDIQYHLGDHLGSVGLTLDAAGGWLNREEFYPYGETSFGGFARKRYRFTGKERDEESGLSYHSARYYAPWLNRWISCDPAGPVDGLNLYVYALDQPISLKDGSGLIGESPIGPKLPSTDARLGAPKGHFGHVGRQGKALRDANGTLASEGEHVMPGSHLEETLRNGKTGKSDYTRKRYDSDATLLVEREMALNKTHANRGGMTADNPRLKSLRQKVARGEGINYREDVMLPSIENTKRARDATNSTVTDAAIHRAVLEQDANLFATMRPDEVMSHLAAFEQQNTLAAKAAQLGGKVLRAVGTALEVGGGVIGSATGGWEVGTGLDQIAHGQVGNGAIDVAEGAANLGLTIGVPIAAKAGVIASEAGVAAGVTGAAAGIAAGASVGLAAETARAALHGEMTPIDVADKFYGTHFGDIYGWVTGGYSH